MLRTFVVVVLAYCVYGWTLPFIFSGPLDNNTTNNTTDRGIDTAMLTKSEQSVWKIASATFYGNAKYNGDVYDLSDGTCSCKKAKNYGVCYNNWCFSSVKDRSKVGAINTAGSSNTRLCGKCVAMKCSVGKYRGTKTSEFGSFNVCRDMKKIIVIQITDSCPEKHQNQNNAKFCDKRNTHFDLSFWAFGILAPHEQGVIDVAYNFVTCPSNITSGVLSESCCKGRTCLMP